MKLRNLMIAVVAIAAFAGSAAAAELAVLDWYNNGIAGPSQSQAMTPASPCVASAVWSTGCDLASNGTPGSHAIWANGWDDNQPGDWFKLTVVAAEPGVCIEGVRWGYKASGSGPDTVTLTASVNGTATGSIALDTSDGDWHNEDYRDLTALNLCCVEPGSVIEMTFTGAGASSSFGSLRFGNYYDGSYHPMALFGECCPEPASMGLLGMGALALIRRRK